jgi:hypothetical protein
VKRPLLKPPVRAGRKGTVLVVDPTEENRHRTERRDSLIALVAGVAVAFAFTLAPTLRFMGWFVRSLFHETGHVAVSWFAGCPSFPAIDLRGHAAAFHQAQSVAVAGLVGLLLAWCVFASWRSRRFRVLATTGLVLWVPTTFSEGFREVAFLLGGHVGEIAFAWFFLRRARTGDGVERGLERPLYAGLGWYFVGSNVLLAGGLVVSAAARAAYASNGSFGMENDYLRVARELGVSIGAVGVFMALATMAVVPLALLRFAPREPGSPAGLRPVRW